MHDHQFESGRNTQSKSHLSAAPASRARNDFQEASAILDSAEGFGGALWDAEMRLAFDAKQAIKEAREADKKAVLQQCMHNFREGMVAEIERWAPRYVELAVAYPQLTNPDAIEWARDRVQKVIDKRLRMPDLAGAVAFVLITMSSGDATERHHWIPPQWMCSPREMLLTIVDEHNGVAHRLEYALKKTLAQLKVEIAINRGRFQPKNWAGSLPHPRSKMKSDLRKAISACWEHNPDLTDKGTLDWLRQHKPTVLPANWERDDSLPGKTFTKVRKLLKDHETLSTAVTRR
jgi:hypothetical protein